MDTEESRLKSLVESPSESLNVEIKSWIDPESPEGKAKIVKAVLAIRNRNGGSLIVGLNDKTLLPDDVSEVRDVRSIFHADKIQGLVSNYSSELFEVAVKFVERGEYIIPIIVVPSGVKSPVAAKSGIVGAKNKTLVNKGDVYFRTLAASGKVSTSIARPEDWREIVEICFNNREADFGGFFRRQLAGLDLASLAPIFAQLNGISKTSDTQSLRQMSENLLVDGRLRFDEALATKSFDPDTKQLLDAARWSVALVIDPSHAGETSDQAFLRTLASSNPGYTGWPVWLDSSGFGSRDQRPKVKSSAWETLIVSASSFMPHLDFSRVHAKGEFFLLRALQDDLSIKVKPKTTLDPYLVVLRVAEVIAVGLAFASSLNWEREKTNLGFAFRWDRLGGRELSSWANPMAHMFPGYAASDDMAATYVEVPLNTPASAIGPYVQRATKELFVLFNGYSMRADAIEDLCTRLVERRLEF